MPFRPLPGCLWVFPRVTRVSKTLGLQSKSVGDMQSPQSQRLIVPIRTTVMSIEREKRSCGHPVLCTLWNVVGDFGLQVTTAFGEWSNPDDRGLSMCLSKEGRAPSSGFVPSLGHVSHARTFVLTIVSAKCARSCCIRYHKWSHCSYQQPLLRGGAASASRVADEVQAYLYMNSSDTDTIHAPRIASSHVADKG